jgi:hypothetical protein
MENNPTDMGNGCESIEELIAWYPSQTLAEEEKLRVESHIAGCNKCAELLQYASSLRDRLYAAYSPHPNPDLLVCYVESKNNMESTERSIIEEHIAQCPECINEIEVLEALEERPCEDASSLPTKLQSRDNAGRSQKYKHSFWETLRAGLFKPVSAAVYLIIAVLAVGLHLMGPGWPGPARNLDSIFPKGKNLPSGTPVGVVLLADKSGRVRRIGEGKFDLAKVDADKPQYILLELVNLDTPPAADGLYMVEIIPATTNHPVIAVEVRGEIFLENYTIGLPLAADALLPGVYTVRVIGPDKETIYHSTFEAE